MSTPCLTHDARAWPGRVTVDDRGRPRVYLGVSSSPVEGWRRAQCGQRDRWVHPAANSGGFQWCARFVVWEVGGIILRRDEHAHHRCLNVWCVDPEHLEVSLAQFHGSFHAFYTKLRDGRGRFTEEPTWPPRSVARFGPIIGRSALLEFRR